LDCIKGVVVGDFTSMSQGNDRPINEIIHNYFGDLNVPILYGIKIGHGTKNLATYLGRTVSLEVNSKEAIIRY